MGGRDCDGGGILSERFLRFRSRLGGESGSPWIGTSEARLGAFSWAAGNDWRSVLRAGGLTLGYESGTDNGDSGEELGEVSGAEGESNMEAAVVGDDSVDPVVIDETLSRCWKGRRCLEPLAEAWLCAPR
jgi:hypothetical protein